jgi:hypothetical protein
MDLFHLVLAKDRQNSKSFRKDSHMKKINTLGVVLFVLLGTLLSSACSTAAAKPVEALAGTDAPVAANVPSSVPAAELSPAAPTPTRMEFSVENARLVVKVMDIEKPHQVYLGVDNNLGTDIYFKPGEGNMFLGVGIKVTNLTGADIPFKWTDIYLVNKYQDKWYPVFGAYKNTNSAMDSSTVEILQYDQVHPDFDPDAHFYAADNGYARVVFRVPRDNLYYFFGFADLPLIEINWRYY